MFRRAAAGLAALSLLLAACGSPASTPSSSGPGAAKSASPVASPQGPTPTAMLALPAPSPSPIVTASPSPTALASPVARVSPVAQPSPSPVAAAPVASPSPVAAGAPTSSDGVLYRVVSERSEARFEAQEKFVERPLPNQAIGRTMDVTGEIQLEGPGSLRGRVLRMQVDLRTLASDSARRDAFIRQNTLQTDQFPFAEFRSTESAGPTAYTEGNEASFQIPGVMTIRGRERPVTWDATAELEGGRLTGTARARIKLSDFGVEAPRLAILTVEDDMTWVVDLAAERPVATVGRRPSMDRRGREPSLRVAHPAGVDEPAQRGLALVDHEVPVPAALDLLAEHGRVDGQ